ncbi:hypothetical protein CHS0354_016902 [Potamilus streckersoni]|uniref:Uncharacterized protein n=1 Tax=Potamilus streckersoni TaxID=2493646 RepID=A0AAE0S787_9BIVA|nr:hypothetical protein CHS0354_016902 [Potamilus streckersoni]
MERQDSEELFRVQRLVKLLTHQTERPEIINEQRGQIEVIYQRETIEDLYDPVHYSDSDDEDTSASIYAFYTEQEADNTKHQQGESSSFKVDLRPSARDSSGINIQEAGSLVTNNDDAMMEFLQLVNEKADKLEKSLVEYAALAMWDFAGQYVFYTTDQTFLTCRAIYLLVTDLSQQFTDLVEDDECFFDTEGVKLCKVQDLVEVWLNSVHCCAQSSATGADSKPDNAVSSPATNTLLTSHGSSAPVPSLDVGIPMTPPVILVGTHMDKIQQDKRQEVVSKYLQQICRILKDKPSLQHLVGFFCY